MTKESHFLFFDDRSDISSDSHQVVLRLFVYVLGAMW